jgi:hypothetical protein
MDTSPSASTITDAIRAGVDYLCCTQLPSGAFTTYTGPRPDLTGANPYPKSVYVPAFVIHSLGYVPDEPVQARIRQLAADFLEEEEEDNGTWNYEGRCGSRLPADLDDTCTAAAALLVQGRRPSRAFYALLWQVIRPNAAAPSGPYYTYLGVNDATDDPVRVPFAREIDSLVNANVVFFCGLLGIVLPGAVAFLQQLVERADYVGHSLAESYSGRSLAAIPPHLVIYVLSRAYADGPVHALAPAMGIMRDYLLTGLPALPVESVALHLACRSVAMLNLAVETSAIDPYLDALLRTQQADGSWPAWAAWVGFPPNYDGSPALTTALALEALGKYQRRADQEI